MPRIKDTVAHIITKLREAEGALSKGQTLVQVSRSRGITEQTYFRWRHEHGGLKIDQVKRLKELGREKFAAKAVREWLRHVGTLAQVCPDLLPQPGVQEFA